MNFNDKTITLDNDKVYIVMETIVIDEMIYAYLVNKDDMTDTLFKKIVNVDDSFYLEGIEKEFFSNKVFPLFLEKFRDYDKN